MLVEDVATCRAHTPQPADQWSARLPYSHVGGTLRRLNQDPAVCLVCVVCVVSFYGSYGHVSTRHASMVENIASIQHNAAVYAGAHGAM